MKKFWRTFISEMPDPAQVKQWAKAFKDDDYQIKSLLKRILLSDSFMAGENRGVLTKFPVEMLVGTLRLLNLNMMGDKQVNRAGWMLKQELFDPPNVKGWPTGKAWITSETLNDCWWQDDEK